MNKQELFNDVAGGAPVMQTVWKYKKNNSFLRRWKDDPAKFLAELHNSVEGVIWAIIKVITLSYIFNKMLGAVGFDKTIIFISILVLVLLQRQGRKPAQ